jgi:hypothetical protein
MPGSFPAAIGAEKAGQSQRPLAGVRLEQLDAAGHVALRHIELGAGPVHAAVPRRRCEDPEIGRVHR